MIKRKITIIYGNKKKEDFLSPKFPWVEGPFFCILLTEERILYIPANYIARAIVQEIWKKNGKPIPTPEELPD